MFESLKEIFQGKKTKSSNLTYGVSSIEDYEYDEIPVQINDDSNIIKMKACDLEDYRDATDITVLVEAGYIVIANTIDMERDMNEDYAAVLKYLQEKIAECDGNIVMLAPKKIMAVPKNVVIEKLIKEPEDLNKPSQNAESSSSIGESKK
ncbi:cell division protein SepF [Methanococcus aeolicus]|jgi:SepF-like predicted cell division protein (DUF552 family)|uniref:DUF552 domain-containing protein n=1 Tax=Methanococcus aeolicus (strain ATCC BAA-1280 / DSM 17508 / OCM 812 / Nankai-3) TaxID=419665 RepID=A6UTW7_META3|nr:cell division protein SepF [Methanococcus aeolicus]ABR55939.1 conserved hypothetical protein [Methanococcus aeolicus Nankai-3]UXM85462.1 cell division protein SepF [Methanococcus aeolicus]